MPRLSGGASTTTVKGHVPGVTVGSADADYLTGDYASHDAAIQAAIDSLSSGGLVTIKAGTYTIENAITLPDDVVLQGVGFGTVLKYADGSSFSGLLRNTDHTNGNDSIVIENLKIDGNSANAGGSDPRDMIWLKKATNCIVRGVFVFDSPDSAIVLDQKETTDCVIENCIIDTADDIGIYVSDTLRSVIADNVIKNTDSYGIRIIRNTSGFAQNCVVAGNSVFNCGQGLSVDGIILQGAAEENVVAGNTVVQAGRYGIHVDGAYNSISSNMVAETDQHGIFLDESIRSQATGNTVHKSGQDTSNTYSGIYLDSATECAVTGNRSGDSGSGTRQKYGIEEGGTSDKNIITGNQLARNGTGGLLVVGVNSEAAHNIES